MGVCVYVYHDLPIKKTFANRFTFWFVNLGLHEKETPMSRYLKDPPYHPLSILLGT